MTHTHTTQFFDIFLLLTYSNDLQKEQLNNGDID